MREIVNGLTQGWKNGGRNRDERMIMTGRKIELRRRGGTNE